MTALPVQLVTMRAKYMRKSFPIGRPQVQDPIL